MLIFLSVSLWCSNSLINDLEHPKYSKRLEAQRKASLINYLALNYINPIERNHIPIMRNVDQLIENIANLLKTTYLASRIGYETQITPQDYMKIGTFLYNHPEFYLWHDIHNSKSGLMAAYIFQRNPEFWTDMPK